MIAIGPSGFQQAPKNMHAEVELECPLCDSLRKPVRVNKDGSVSYTCPPDHKNHGNRYTWRIGVNGELID